MFTLTADVSRNLLNNNFWATLTTNRLLCEDLINLNLNKQRAHSLKNGIQISNIQKTKKVIKVESNKDGKQKPNNIQEKIYEN